SRLPRTRVRPFLGPGRGNVPGPPVTPGCALASGRARLPGLRWAGVGVHWTPTAGLDRVGRLRRGDTTWRRPRVAVWASRGSAGAWGAGGVGDRCVRLSGPDQLAAGGGPAGVAPLHQGE